MQPHDIYFVLTILITAEKVFLSESDLTSHQEAFVTTAWAALKQEEFTPLRL